MKSNKFREFGQTVQERDTLAPIQASDSLAKGAIIADVLVTVIVIAGMAYDSHSVTISVLSGVTFFLLFGALVILTLSGALPAMVINGQNQKTTRQLHRLQYTAQMEQAQRVTVVDHPQLPYEAPAPMQLPSSPSFVPAVAPVEDNLRFMAAGFINELFDLETGEFHPKRVTPNAKQIQRKPPNKDVEKYLEQLGVIVRGKGGQWYWNESLFPTRMEAINATRRGRPSSLLEREGVEGRVGYESGVQP